MLSLLKYAGLFCVTTGACLTAWAIVMAPLHFLEKTQARWKNAVALASFLACPFAAFLILSLMNVYPPRLFQKPSSLPPAAIEQQVAEVDTKGKQLVAAFNNPQQLTLQQLRDLVEQAKDYANQATTVSLMQEAQIAALRQTVEAESKKAEEAQRLAASIKSLTSDQLNAVKLLITKDATEQSKQSFINGALVSFPIGVVSSFIASALWERFRAKKQRILETIDHAVTHKKP